MKKSIVILIAICIIGISVSFIGIYVNKQKRIESKLQNKEFEIYSNDYIYGAEAITLINKAINENEKNNVPKDSSGYFLDDNQNSVIIELVMITNEEKKLTNSYRMEKIAKVGIEQFISNFNTAKFKITKVEYHKLNGKIKYIEVTQQYE